MVLRRHTLLFRQQIMILLNQTKCALVRVLSVVPWPAFLIVCHQGENGRLVLGQVVARHA